ncbi:MAG: polyprenyl synthetase family protein [Thermoplasmata archaeon]|nr:MAG: polyprenyl synthetase family protein [Thermoplasmata archaeon]KAA0015722.1 MAG: polyprenyl synthetase family protein [Thermoplasmata archaeon]
MAEKYKNFEEFFSSYQKLIREEIDKRIKDEDMRYALNGGKLLRPSILMLSFIACNGKNFERAMESAIGIELAHSASLIHDDIMDNDKERRGKPAFHVKKGIGKAILIGHKMINEAFRISLKHGKKNAQIFLDSWNEAVTGQILDIDVTARIKELIKNKNIEEIIREYFNIINLKTASLFSVACRAGAIEADAPEDLIENMAKYGREVGIAYQLADDLVDMLSGKLDDSIMLAVARFKEHVGDADTNDLTDLFKNIDKEFLKSMYIEEIKKHIEKAQSIVSSEKRINPVFAKILKEAPVYIVNKMLESVGVVI